LGQVAAVHFQFFHRLSLNKALTLHSCPLLYQMLQFLLGNVQLGINWIALKDLQLADFSGNVVDLASMNGKKPRSSGQFPCKNERFPVA